MFDELKEIYLEQKTDLIIPFLKKLTPKDIKELRPKISSLREMSNYRRGQEPIFFAIALLCCNKAQYKDVTRWVYASGLEIYNDILDWHNPSWFSEIINEKYDGNLRPKYHLLVEWQEKGYVTLKPETIAEALVDNFSDFKKYPVTLREHIWYIFEYETTINWSDYHGSNGFTNTFANLADEGKIDRIRLLRECLLTANRNFNKNLTGWFTDLFNDLKPTEDELLTLQPQLLGVLNSLQSKAQNNALNHIKVIVKSAQFDVDEFLRFIPILVSSTVKATVKNTIDIAEKLLGTKKELTKDICIALCGGFVSKDEAIQKKLAKLLSKYGDKDSLAEPLSVYSDNILKSVEPLLIDFLDGAATTGASTPIAEEYQLPLPLIRDDNRIERVSTFEDYIFFLNQAFDSNNVYDITYIPVYIQQFKSQITADNISMLEPSIKKVIQVSESWSDKIGLIHKLYALFFLHYVSHLGAEIPLSDNIKKMMDRPGRANFVNWRSKYLHPETYPHYFMLLKVFDSIKNGKQLDLLSTPTHAPMWIEPVTLVQRLIDYQQKDIQPGSFDMQFAILQCALENTGNALELAKKELKGELQDIMIFLLDKDTEVKKEVAHPAWWMTASMAKYPNRIPKYTNEWGFSDIPEEYLTGNFEWRVERTEYNALKFNIIMPAYHAKNVEQNTVSQYYDGRFRSRMLYNGDIQLLICSSPYCHDTITVHAMDAVFFSEVSSSHQQVLANVLMTVLNLNLPLTKMDCLLLAKGMVASDKTNRTMAAEVWLTFLRQQRGMSRQIGCNIGKMLGEYAPAKRLTDLIENNLMIGSPMVNRELETLVTGVLSEIKSPVTNLKKLLEIYKELLALNNSKADMENVPQLNDWAKENSLKKIVQQIMQTAG